jgi:Flp pilus assembly protein TadD/GGDEF domain-containing protein
MEKLGQALNQKAGAIALNLENAASWNIAANDLIKNEAELRRSLKRSISFDSGSIYFPRTPPNGLVDEQGNYQPLHLGSENKLFLPLAGKQGLLGIFLAQGVRLEEPQSQCRLLMEYCRLFLYNLSLQKEQKTDAESGALQRENLLLQIEQEIELISHCHQPGQSAPDEFDLAPYRSQLGILLIYLHHQHSLRLNYGCTFTQRLLQEMVSLLSCNASGEHILGRAGESCFALLLPQAEAAACRQTGQGILQSLDGLQLEYPATTERIKPQISCGYSCYPQDLTGPILQQSPREQAATLLRNGLLAAKKAPQSGLGQSILGFTEILTQGGSIIKNLPLNRVLLNLGRVHLAREGQRFLLAESGSFAQPKAEIILTKVDWQQSEGEILHLSHPSRYPEAGDRLLHQPGKQDQVESAEDLEQANTQTSTLEPLSLRSFLQAWQKARASADRFCLVLCSSQALDRQKPWLKLQQPGQDNIWAQLRERLLQANVILGEYSSCCWILYIPELGEQGSTELLQVLQKALQQLLPDRISIGQACYPCLGQSKAELLDSARKALEHALLLPGSEIVSLDSTSLTISADRYFNQNNLTAALEEYKLALLLDQDNALARNSLGICYARLGQTHLACREFQRALEQEPENHLALFNFGYVSWRLGDLGTARACFQRCLELASENGFSLLRLGQIAEQQGQTEQARQMYSRAAQSNAGQKFAYRFLGRMDLQENRLEEARENLHLALNHNPEDCEAMHLLAKLYLQQNEDPEIAELLLKKSVALRPEQPEYVQLLAQVLSSQGKTAELQHLRTRTSHLPSCADTAAKS